MSPRAGRVSTAVAGRSQRRSTLATSTSAILTGASPHTRTLQLHSTAGIVGGHLDHVPVQALSHPVATRRWDIRRIPARPPVPRWAGRRAPDHAGCIIGQRRPRAVAPIEQHRQPHRPRPPPPPAGRRPAVPAPVPPRCPGAERSGRDRPLPRRYRHHPPQGSPARPVVTVARVKRLPAAAPAASSTSTPSGASGRYSPTRRS